MIIIRGSGTQSRHPSGIDALAEHGQRCRQKSHGGERAPKAAMAP